DAVARMFAGERKRVDRDERDRAAVELFELLAARQAVRPSHAWQKLLEVRAAFVADRVQSRHQAEARRVLAALRELRGRPAEKGSQPLALGEVAVAADEPLPPPPALQIDWPEPYSLLAIPAPDGSLRDWFDDSGGSP